jgi:putative DNA primase/helicase
MTHVSGRPDPLEDVLSRLRKVRKSSTREWIASCPAHDDRNPSLSISLGEDEKILLYCHAGCSTEAVLGALGMKMADLFPTSSAPIASHRGLSLVEFAREKKLPWRYLVNQGVVEDPRGGLRIQYYNLDRTPASRWRIRTDLIAKRGSFWNKEPGELLPYGLEHLEAARQKGCLFLVEGETDTLTLRSHEYPALGIPGAEMVKTTMQLSYIDSIDHLYIIQEPDPAGQRFAEDILSLLANWSWGGKAYVVSLPDAKDPNELHQRNPKGFSAAFRQALDAASLRYDGSPVQNEPPATIQQPEQALNGVFTLQHLLVHKGRKSSTIKKAQCRST